MEYRHLLPLLAVFVAVLASDVVFARRPAETDDFDNGSGSDVYGSGSTDDDDDDDDEGGSTDEHQIGIGMVSRAPEKDRTTSIYVNGVDISAIDEGDSEDVKVEALTSLILHPAVLAAIIVGGVLIILFIILIIMFVVYRMRKKDEGSYVLDDPKTMIVGIDHQQHQQASSSLVYIKAPTNGREFYA